MTAALSTDELEAARQVLADVRRAISEVFIGDLAPVDIDGHAFDLSHVELEDGPTVVLHAAEGEFSSVLIDPAWVDRQCDEAAAHAINELRDALAAAETHRPCCSSHGRHMTCAEYRRTHFVEVGPCCSIWAALNGAHQ